MATVGSLGERPGQFTTPFGVAFNAGGELFVSDTKLRRIQVFDVNGAFVQILDLQHKLDKPTGLAFTKQGYLVVADNGRVIVFDETGKKVAFYSIYNVGMNCRREFQPVGVCVWDNTLYITDNSWNSTTRHGERAQIYQTQIDKFDARLNCLNNTYGMCCQAEFIAASAHGLFVSDSARNCVQEFVKREQVQLFRVQNRPRGVAVDKGGRLFVGCTSACSVALMV